MKREQFSNNASSSLNGAITDSATTLVVDDASSFPADGDFRIIINSEILLVTGVSSNTFTVARAQEDTTGVAHDDNSLVLQLITAEGLRRIVKDNVLYAFDKPQMNAITDEDKAVLIVTDFGTVNIGSPAPVDSVGCIFFNAQSSADTTNARLLTYAAPAAPYVCTLGFRPRLRNNAGGSGGDPKVVLGFRSSAAGEMTLLGYWFSLTATGFIVEDLTNESTLDATPVAAYQLTLGSDIWLRIEDDNTDHNFSVSGDGVNFYEIGSQGRTTQTPNPNQIVFGIDSGGFNTADHAATFFHFSID